MGETPTFHNFDKLMWQLKVKHLKLTIFNRLQLKLYVMTVYNTIQL